MVFGNLCAPALIYIVFSVTQITLDTFKGLYNTAMVKLIVSLLFTILLNHLCERGMGVISWIIVFLPFILMSLVVAMLLVVLGLNPTTGKMEKENKSIDENEKQKQIQNYNMKLQN
jgi:predicted membrane protein